MYIQSSQDHCDCAVPVSITGGARRGGATGGAPGGPRALPAAGIAVPPTPTVHSADVFITQPVSVNNVPVAIESQAFAILLIFPLQHAAPPPPPGLPQPKLPQVDPHVIGQQTPSRPFGITRIPFCDAQSASSCGRGGLLATALPEFPISGAASPPVSTTPSGAGIQHLTG